MIKYFIVFLFSILCPQNSFSASLCAPSDEDSGKIQKVHDICGITRFEKNIARSGKSCKEIEEIEGANGFKGITPVVLCAAYNVSRKILKAMCLPEVDDALAVWGILKENGLDERIVKAATCQYEQQIKASLEGKEVLGPMEQLILELIKSFALID